MARKASKEAIVLLQKIFDFLGRYGGTIETDSPSTWWSLYFDADKDDANDNRILSQIGVFKHLNGDIIFDPEFKIVMHMDGERIDDVDIIECAETTVFGTSVVDDNDNISMGGITEKDEIGLVERFSEFMHNMVEVGPYLTNPKKIEKYDKYISE